MLTNSRLLELRATRLKCIAADQDGNATPLAEDYIELFELVEDYVGGCSTDGITGNQPSTLDALFGK